MHLLYSTPFGFTPNHFISIIELVFYYSRVIHSLRSGSGGQSQGSQAQASQIQDLQQQLQQTLYDLNICHVELGAVRERLAELDGQVFGAVADYNLFHITEEEIAAGVMTIQQWVESGGGVGSAAEMLDFQESLGDFIDFVELDHFVEEENIFDEDALDDFVLDKEESPPSLDELITDESPQDSHSSSHGILEQFVDTSSSDSLDLEDFLS